MTFLSFSVLFLRRGLRRQPRLHIVVLVQIARMVWRNTLRKSLQLYLLLFASNLQTLCLLLLHNSLHLHQLSLMLLSIAHILNRNVSPATLANLLSLLPLSFTIPRRLHLHLVSLRALALFL